MPEREYNTLPEHLLLYDGECGLCDHAVQFLLDHDTRRVLHYSPLQGEVAKRILSENPQLQKLDSILYVRSYKIEKAVSSRDKRSPENQTSPKIQIFWHSSAVIEIAKELPFPWNLIVAFRIIPTFLLDKVYLFIARHRLQFLERLSNVDCQRHQRASRFL